MTPPPDDPILTRAAARRAGIASFIVMDVMQAAASAEAGGRDIVHMEVGQPGTPAPRAAREAVKRALDADPLGYTLPLGTDALRERIARHYRDVYGVAVAPQRIVVTAGSSAGFVLAFLALFDAGARVGLPSPGYPCYRQILSVLGCAPVAIETGPANGWMPEPGDLAAAGPLEGLLIASPANPTGTMLSRTRLEALVRHCREQRIWFISDEIYHGLTYRGPADTALSFGDQAIVINSFSKYFSMTGWRIGWMVVPDALVRTIERLAQNLYISPPAISQAAALGAFDGIDELEANKAVYAKSRDLLMEELPRAGFRDIVPADGAFYLYCDVSDRTSDSVALCRRILDEAGVAVTPGLDFDPVRGARFLRFSYARANADIAEGARRLKVWHQARG